MRRNSDAGTAAEDEGAIATAEKLAHSFEVRHRGERNFDGAAYVLTFFTYLVTALYNTMQS